MIRLQSVLILLSFALLSLITSCSESLNTYEGSDQELSGTGVLISELRELPAFSAISSSGPITTVITRGDTKEVLVTADDNIIQRVKTTVRAQKLYISLDEGQYHNIWIRVQLRLPEIKALDNSGSGTMKAGNLMTDNALKAVNSGTGTLMLQGRATHLNLMNEGSGSIQGFDLISERCTVQNTGNGLCELFCTGLLEGQNTGSGSIYYKGKATVAIENTGSGEVLEVWQEAGADGKY